jgi:hypothetical protein
MVVKNSFIGTANGVLFCKNNNLRKLKPGKSRTIKKTVLVLSTQLMRLEGIKIGIFFDRKIFYEKILRSGFLSVSLTHLH